MLRVKASFDTADKDLLLRFYDKSQHDFKRVEQSLKSRAKRDNLVWDAKYHKVSNANQVLAFNVNYIINGKNWGYYFLCQQDVRKPEQLSLRLIINLPNRNKTYSKEFSNTKLPMFMKQVQSEIDSLHRDVMRAK